MPPYFRSDSTQPHHLTKASPLETHHYIHVADMSPYFGSPQRARMVPARL